CYPVALGITPESVSAQVELAFGVWTVSLILAWLMEAVNMQGPFEKMHRRLSYGSTLQPELHRKGSNKKYALAYLHGLLCVILVRMAPDDTQPPRPRATSAGTARMVVPDVARGLALLGIAVANLPTAWLTPSAPHSEFLGSVNTVWDQILAV